MKIKLAASLLLFLLSSCTIETDEKAGPDGSWWLGGDDGGVFVNIQEDSNPDDNLYQGVIYFDNNQEIWYKGEFELVGNIKFSPENREQYVFWDGEKLHLLDSSYLQPTQPIPPL